MSQPGLLSLLDTCTIGLSTHPARWALCISGDAGAHIGATPVRVSHVQELRQTLPHVAGLQKQVQELPHAHTSPTARTAPCPSAPKAPCQPPQSRLSTFPTAGSARGCPCPHSCPAGRRGAGSEGSCQQFICCCYGIRKHFPIVGQSPVGASAPRLRCSLCPGAILPMPLHTERARQPLCSS